MCKSVTIKQLLQNISLIVVLNLLVKPVWVLTENVVHSTLGHEQYGIYASLFSLVLVFSVLADWGISNYSVHRIAGNTDRYESVFSSLFLIRVGITIAFPVVMVGLGWLLGYQEEELFLLAVIAITQTLVYFLAFFRAKFQAFQAFKTDGFMSVLERIMLIVVVWSLLGAAFDLNTFVLSRLGAITAAVFFAFLLVIRRYGWVKLRLSGKEVSQSLKGALPFTVMTLLYAFNERVDMVMVERMDSPHEAGLYAGAYRWYDALMMFVWIIQPILFSRFSKAHGENTGASTLFNQGFLIVSIPMLLITPFLFFDGRVLFFLFTNSTVQELYRMNDLFQLLMISFIFNALFVVMGTYLNASGFVGKVNRIILFCALLNVVLNFIYIPQNGAYAAGFTTAISTGCMGLGYFILVMLSRLRVDILNLTGVLVSFVASFVCYYYIRSMAATLWWPVAGGALVFFMVLTLFGIPRKIKQNFG